MSKKIWRKTTGIKRLESSQFRAEHSVILIPHLAAGASLLQDSPAGLGYRMPFFKGGPLHNYEKTSIKLHLAFFSHALHFFRTKILFGILF